jgi:hypothetical protein
VIVAGFLSEAEFEREIARLCDLPRHQLIERWRRATRGEPPKGISTVLLRRALAYEVQARRWRGLGQATRRLLRRKTGGSGGDASTKRTTMPRAGDRLVREWNGRTYLVDVVEGGFLMEGTVYRSLSAVAYAITAARWSGPRFFGLGRKP